MPAASEAALQHARTIVLGPEAQSSMYSTVFFRSKPDPASLYRTSTRSAPTSALVRATKYYDRAVALVLQEILSKLDK